MTDPTPAPAPAPAPTPTQPAQPTQLLEEIGLDDTASVGVAPAEAGAERPRTPRTRWAAIVWGLVLGVLALAGVWLTADPERLDAALTWAGELDAGAAVAYGLLAIGALLLIGGLAGLLRRAQVAASRR